MTKVAREARWFALTVAMTAINIYGIQLTHNPWIAILACAGTSTSAWLAINYGMRLASAWRYQTLPEIHREPTPDELRAPFMAAALAEVDDMKLGGARLVAPAEPKIEMPAGPSLDAQLAGGWMSTGAGLDNATPGQQLALAAAQRNVAYDPWTANQREPEASPSYPQGREPESVALQGQILSGWRESYAKRTRYRL